MNGNVGIGTWTAAGGNLIVNGGGNVGIGSAWPGQRVDVNGTVRMTGMTMSGSSPISGYVLTASDSAGDTTWSSPGSVSGWVFVGNNLYNTNSGNVGINTVNGANVGIGTSTPQGGFVVTNGNVGIGTWSPVKPFTVIGDTYHNGNIGVGTTLTTTSALAVMNGNVGVGTWVPAGLLQVNNPGASPFVVTSVGNVGIGTVTPQSGLNVTNGNVGIGTWTAANALSIVGGVGIGPATYASTTAPANGLIVSGNVGIGDDHTASWFCRDERQCRHRYLDSSGW